MSNLGGGGGVQSRMISKVSRVEREKESRKQRARREDTLPLRFKVVT